MKPTGNYINNATGYILSGINEGLFIVVLEKYCGRKALTIVLNRGLNVIYDCIETHEMQLNHKNSCKYCRVNNACVKLCTTAELINIKVHAKKR